MAGEEAFLETLRSLSGVSPDLGDDCGLIQLADQTLLVTVDSLNETVHFDPTTSPRELARKLVGVNVSDVAAMGGYPRWALLAEGSRDERDVREQFCRELTDLLREQGIELTGGDIGDVASDRCRFYSMTVLGETHPEGILRRNNAEAGEKLAVTGTLGGPASLRETGEPPWNQEERKWLFDPPNRVTEGHQLVETGVRCAIDLSDGLLKDLNRILSESNVGARLDWRSIPTACLVEERAVCPEERLKWSLVGGEDFELLFTIPEDVQVPFGHFTVIGEITDTKGLEWDPPLPPEVDLTETGYDHLI